MEGRALFQYYNTSILVMLLKVWTNIDLKQTITKINTFSTAYDRTFVLSAVVRPGKSEAIIHIDSKGEVIHRYDFTCIIGRFGMLSQKEVIVLNTSNSTIDLINLQTHTITHINHQFHHNDCDTIDIFTFYDTKYFCIVEHENANKNGFRLTYYNHKNNKDYTPILIHDEEVEDRELTIVKANNHSKMIWLQVEQSEVIEFSTISLKGDAEVKRKIHVPNTLITLYNMDNMEVFIHNIWENRDEIFTLVCSTNRERQEQQEEDNDMQEEGKPNKHVLQHNSNFVVDAEQGTIRQAAYFLVDDISGKGCNENIFCSLNLGSETVYFIGSSAAGDKSAPLFFVNNKTERVIAKDQWQPDCYNNFFAPGFDDSTLILSRFDNGDVNNIQVMTAKWAEMKQIFVHFMLHLNEDFDDDLLQDALEIMDEI